MRIISGGQSGVDRAALDVALALGIPCGGFCPRGRRAEDGTIPDVYPLTETASAEYPERTERNVSSSDATLILRRGDPDRGTALTARMANRHRKPLYMVDLAQPADEEPQRVKAWLRQQKIEALNVAGPRASSQEGIYEAAAAFLRAVFAE
jgi:Circularly permutated YpsA SLOG family